MAKKTKKEEILEDVSEYLDDHLSGALPAEEKLIAIPTKDIEALLVCHDTSNRVGITAVCEEIRRMAQEQNPEHFLR